MSGDGYFEALSSMLDSGVGLLVGTCDASGVPRAGRAWGIRPDGDRVRVVVGADDPILIANADQRVVAITGADVRNLRSTQLKGRVVVITEPDEADLAVADANTDCFLTAIRETDGTPYELTSRLLPRRMVTIVIDVSAGFDQTPGPEAGSPLPEPV